MERTIEFSWYDYMLFGGMLGLSTLIGIYFGFFDKKHQKSAEEYLLGSKEMKILPIALSLIASWTSGITLLAVPTDVYEYGAQYSLIMVCICTMVFTGYFIYLPVYYKVKITSIYEYLMMRFDNRTRLLTSFLYCLQVTLYLPIVIYIPALAFSQATGFNVHVITPLLCSVCIFYTTIGGLKAVVWTDSLQFLGMIGGVVAVMVIGIVNLGGLCNVFARAHEGGSLTFEFNPSPLLKDSFWVILFGLFIHSTTVFSNQGFVQKFISLPSLREGKSALVLFVIGLVLLTGSSVFTGVIMYATYKDCDPLKAGIVERADQLLPYFVLDVAGHVPGLPGLFIAGIVCAALSTMSATMNSLAGSIFRDFVCPLLPREPTKKAAGNLLMAIVFTIGVITTAMVYVVEQLGGLLSLTVSFNGITYGAILGVFTIGMMMPSVTKKGAFYGTLASLLAMASLSFTAQYYKYMGLIHHPRLTFTFDGCSETDDAVFPANSTASVGAPHEAESQVPSIVLLSGYLYPLVGIIIVFLVAIPISWLGDNDDRPVHPDLITPICHRFLRPESVKLSYFSVEEATKHVTCEFDDFRTPKVELAFVKDIE